MMLTHHGAWYKLKLFHLEDGGFNHQRDYKNDETDIFTSEGITPQQLIVNNALYQFDNEILVGSFPIQDFERFAYYVNSEYKPDARSILSSLYNKRIGLKGFCSDGYVKCYMENTGQVWNNGRIEENYIELLDSLDTHFNITAGAMQFFDIKNNYAFSARSDYSYTLKNTDKYKKTNFGHTEMLLFRSCFDDFAKKVDPTEHQITTIEKSVRGFNPTEEEKIFEMSQYLYNNAFEKRAILETKNIITLSIIERSPCVQNGNKYIFNCTEFLQKGYPKNSINFYLSEYGKEDKVIAEASKKYCDIYSSFYGIPQKYMDKNKRAIIINYTNNEDHDYSSRVEEVPTEKLNERLGEYESKVKTKYPNFLIDYHQSFYVKKDVYYPAEKITISKEFDSNYSSLQEIDSFEDLSIPCNCSENNSIELSGDNSYYEDSSTESMSDYSL